ncbi:MAG: hypothetical protein JWN17_2401 [Frankiales bacterium]|nr:hypothetical protein [Frankiales bacterium]
MNGLPEPRRVVLPVPPGGLEAARREGARRRRAVLAPAAAAVVAVLAVSALALPGRTPPVDRLYAALDPRDGGVPGRVTGRVSDPSGRPLGRIAVLPNDLSRVLTRTDADGRFLVPCVGELVLAPYAPSAVGAPVTERAPGAGDHAWRRVRGRCGGRTDVVLAAGAVVTGRGTPGTDVHLARVRNGTAEVAPGGPVFTSRVLPDGTWRVDGLDTGRYRLDDGRLVDAKQGRTTTAH